MPAPASVTPRRRVAVDARMVRHSGIGAYIRGLFGGILDAQPARGADGWGIVFLGDPAAIEQAGLAGRGATVVRHTARIYGVAERMSALRPARAVGLHVPHYNLPWRPGLPAVVTIHDLIHVVMPEVLGSRMKAAYARSIMNNAAAKAAVILADCAWSAGEIATVLRVPREKIVVAPCAPDDDWTRMEDAQARELHRTLGLPDRYLLAMGSEKMHKNLLFAVRAFLDWPRRHDAGMRLLVCGVNEGPAGRTFREAVKQMDPGNVVRIMPFLDRNALRAVCQCADALVFPSLYEGFGLPVLEAQQLGTPVVASNATCLPEVGGDGALYFDPRSPAELHARLDALLADGELRVTLVEHGLRNVKRYSWRSSAATVIEVYERVFG